MPIFYFNFFLFSFSGPSFSISIFLFDNLIQFCCDLLMTAMSTLVPIFHLTFISFLISFSGSSFYISIFLLLFFYSITLFYLIFVLYQRLQCRHSCQYFVHMYCDSTVFMWSAIVLPFWIPKAENLTITAQLIFLYGVWAWAELSNSGNYIYVLLQPNGEPLQQLLPANKKNWNETWLFT